MRESKLWERVKRGFSKFQQADVRRIENKCEPGTPDVEYCIAGACGWIELKSIPKAPVRSNSVVRVDHYTGEQRAWAMKRISCGGRVWVLLMVDEELFLLEARLAVMHLGTNWTMEHLRILASYCSQPGANVDWGRIKALITE